MVVFIIIKKRSMQRDGKDGDRTQIIRFLGQEEEEINKKRLWIFHPPFPNPKIHRTSQLRRCLVKRCCVLVLLNWFVCFKFFILFFSWLTFKAVLFAPADTAP